MKNFKSFKLSVLFLLLSSLTFSPALTLGQVTPKSSEQFPLVLMTKGTRDDNTLNVDKTVEKLAQIAADHKENMKMTLLGHAEGENIYKIDLASAGSGSATKRPLKIAIAAGVHGNEPMTIVSLVDVIEELLKRKDLLEKFTFVIYPMVNPYGLRHCTRESRDCKDLNRSFQDGSWNKISRLISESIEREGAIKAALDLHGSGRKGIFIIKIKEDDDCLACKALAKIPAPDVQPSETGTYPGVCKGGGYTMLSPGEAMSRNVGTLKEFFYTKGVPYCYTFEYPRAQPLEKQIELMTHLVLEYINKVDEKFGANPAQ